MEEGKWFPLIDKVWSEKNLQSALREVVENGGVLELTDAAWRQWRDGAKRKSLSPKVTQEQRADKPEPVKRVWIPKLGKCGEAPLGSAHGARSDRAGGSAQGDRTNL